MNPKEKAHQLIDRFFMAECLYDEIVWNQAKICALLCVDEILDILPQGIHPYDRIKKQYWTKVKEEISKY